MMTFPSTYQELVRAAKDGRYPIRFQIGGRGPKFDFKNQDDLKSRLDQSLIFRDSFYNEIAMQAQQLNNQRIAVVKSGNSTETARLRDEISKLGKIVISTHTSIDKIGLAKMLGENLATGAANKFPIVLTREDEKKTPMVFFNQEKLDFYIEQRTQELFPVIQKKIVHLAMQPELNPGKKSVLENISQFLKKHNQLPPQMQFEDLRNEVINYVTDWTDGDQFRRLLTKIEDLDSSVKPLSLQDKYKVLHDILKTDIQPLVSIQVNSHEKQVCQDTIELISENIKKLAQAKESIPLLRQAEPAPDQQQKAERREPPSRPQSPS